MFLDSRFSLTEGFLSTEALGWDINTKSLTSEGASIYRGVHYKIPYLALVTSSINREEPVGCCALSLESILHPGSIERTLFQLWSSAVLLM